MGYQTLLKLFLRMPAEDRMIVFNNLVGVTR